MTKNNLSIFIYSMAGGGAERIVSILIKELSNKYNITLILMNDTVDYEIKGIEKIIYLERSKMYENGFIKLLKLPWLAIKYRNILISNNIELSLSLLTRPNYISILSQLFYKKCKIVISEHSFLSKMYGNRDIKSKINRFMIKLLFNKADKIVAISKLIKQDMVENYSIKKNKIIQIYNPFDINYILSKSKEKLDFRFDKFTFLTVGRLDDGKNHKLIIEAFKELNIDNTQLIILGEGNNRKKIVNLIKKYNLEKQIFVLGFDSNPYRYMSKSNVFILSSNYEGLPTVLIESMICNLPIISTDCKSGPREILAPKTDFKNQLNSDIEIAEYGILTPVDSIKYMRKAMEIIYYDNSIISRYKKAYSRRVTFFSKDIIIKKYYEAINDLMSHK